MRRHPTSLGMALAALLSLPACRDKTPAAVPDAAPSAAPSASAPDPFAGRKASVELDVSLGGAPEHVVLEGEQVGRLDPKDVWIAFTLSQSNEQPAGHPARWTLSLQTHQLPLVGERTGAQGHLRYKGVIYGDVTPCALTITSQGPAQGPNRARWVVGLFSCDKMSSGADAGTVVRITNGRFEGPFVDTGG